MGAVVGPSGNFSHMRPKSWDKHSISNDSSATLNWKT